MISKALKAHSFYHTCRYVLQKPGAEVLVAEGVREDDFKLMAEDFEAQQQLRPGKEKAGAHFILSFHPNEKPTDEVMRKLAQEYLTRLGVVNTQFAVVKHTDKDHLHMHIVANMVDNDGKAISDSWIGLRGKKIAQQLTQQYKLIPAIGKNAKLQHVGALNESEAVKYEIYEAIAECLQFSRTFQDLQDHLLKRGIATQYKYKGKTDEIQGISFKKSNLCFKGSEIDRKFSYSNLKKTLETQRRQEVSTGIKTPKQAQPPTLSQRKKAILLRSAMSTQPASPIQSTGNGLGKLVQQLLKPIDAGGGSAPYEFSQEEEIRKRKKKKKGPSL